MEKPLISVLIAAYNAGDTVERAIISCLDQSLREIEVIAIDDGSQDETPAILRDLTGQDDRIRVFSHPNVGLTRSLNQGLRLCRAPIVARLDADDECMDNRLKEQWFFLNTHPDYGLVGGQVMLENSHGRTLLKLPVTHQEILRMLPVENPMVHPATAFRRQVVTDLGGYDESFRYSQDYDLWFRLLNRTKGHNLPFPVTLRRISSQMIGESHGQAQLACSIRARLKNLGISPDKQASLKAALKLGLKLPVYFPAIRRLYREFISKNNVL